MPNNVFEAAVDFLENGSDPPKQVTNKFLAACLRQVHYEAKCSVKMSRTNKHEIDKMKQWFKWLAGGNGLGIMVVLAKLFGLF